MSDLFLLESSETDASIFLKLPPGWYLTQRAEKPRLPVPVPEGTHGAPGLPWTMLTPHPHPCSWAAEEWEHCTKTCGTSGYQLRTVRCLQPLHDGTNRSVHSKYCAGDRPESRRPCNRVPCPAQWKTGPWNEVCELWGAGVGGGGSMCVQACETYFNFTSVSGGLCVNGETVTLFGITKHLGILRKKWYFKTVFAYKIHWWGQTTFGCFGVQSCLKGDWFSNSVDRTVPPRCVSNP